MVKAKGKSKLKPKGKWKELPKLTQRATIPILITQEVLGYDFGIVGMEAEYIILIYKEDWIGVNVVQVYIKYIGTLRNFKVALAVGFILDLMPTTFWLRSFQTPMRDGKTYFSW